MFTLLQVRVFVDYYVSLYTIFDFRNMPAI